MCKIWGASYTLLSFVFPAFDFILSLCLSACLHLSPHPLSSSSSLAYSFHALFHQVSSLKCQVFSPVQTANETPLRGASEAHWWLHFAFPSYLSYMNICLSVFVSVAVLLFLSQSILLSVLLASPVASLSFTLCPLFPTALSCANERMSDEGVDWEMEPVIYFPVYCRARLGPDSPRPRAVLPWGLLVHVDTAHTRVENNILHPYICTHTHTHCYHPAATVRLMFAGVSESGSQNNTL